VQTVLGLMSEKVEWNEAEHFTYWTGGPFVGPQAVLNGVFARIGQDFDGFTVDVGRVVGCGDTVLSEGRYRGTVKATASATARSCASSSTSTPGRSRRPPASPRRAERTRGRSLASRGSSPARPGEDTDAADLVRAHRSIQATAAPVG